MDRRELLKMIAVLTGGAVVGGDLFLAGCKTGPKADAGFSQANVALLDEVGETIIPAGKTPGAKAAGIGNFMKTMVTDCYTPDQQQAFVTGIASLDGACKNKFGKAFIDCDATQRQAVLVGLEQEAKDFNKKVQEKDKPRREEFEKKQRPYDFVASPLHYYTMMKQLTLLGFFTSKTGMTETLRHEPVPGRYDGAMAYSKGDKAWAE